MSILHPLAKEELYDAALYYNERSLGLGERFLNDFENTLSFVEAMPNAWADYIEGVKKLNFKIFPYSIMYVYEQGNPLITIIAIQHQSRLPLYWKNRI
jgi:toxin ParE1/3/4